jgi:hypothetical protein
MQSLPTKKAIQAALLPEEAMEVAEVAVPVVKVRFPLLLSPTDFQ